MKVEPQPKILVAALRQGMLRLAGRVGDGAIINWLSADDVKKVAPYVKEAGADKEIVARIFVAPNPNKEQVRAMAKFAIAAYLNVPVYAAFHEWLGRGPKLAGHVGRVEEGRPQGGDRGDPRRGRRRADRARLARRSAARTSSATSTRASTRPRSRSCRSASTRARRRATSRR